MILNADVLAYVTAHPGLTTYAIALGIRASPRYTRSCLWQLQQQGLVVQTLPAGTWAHT